MDEDSIKVPTCMLKKVLVIFAMMFLSFLRAQNSITFTIYIISPSNSITCSNPAVSFIACSDHSATVSYLWISPLHSFSGSNVLINEPGIYTVTAYATNAQSAPQIVTVAINTIAPVCTITPVSQTISCTNPSLAKVTGTTNLSSNLSQNFISPLGGTYISNAPTATYMPGAPGTYTYEVTDLMNGCKASKGFTVTSLPGFPAFSLSTNNHFVLGCGLVNNGVLTINNATTTSGSVSYTLIGPLTSTAVTSGTLSNSNIYTVTTPGTYTVITRDNSTFCDTRLLVSVIQNTLGPDLKVIVPMQVLNCKVAQTLLLAASSITDIAYTWTWQGNPGSAIGNTITAATNTASGTGTLANSFSLQALNDINQCTTKTVVPVYQDLFTPHALIAGSTATLTCSNPSIVLNNQSVTGIPNGVFSNSLNVSVISWLAPLPQSPANTNTYTAYTSGVYTLHVIDQNNGCKDTANVAIFDGKVYPVVNYPSPPPPFCINSSVTSVSIFPLVTNALSSYVYSWSGSAPTTPANTATVTANVQGIYTVVVTDAANNCSSRANVIVASCFTGLSENRNTFLSLSVSPNPSQGLFRIQDYKPEIGCKVRIYSTLSALIKEFEYPDNNEIDLTEQEKGVYFLQVLQNNTLIHISKLIKE